MQTPHPADGDPDAGPAPMAPPERAPGPVFVIGRQHCGNSLLTTIIGRLPDCFAIGQEGTFFAQRWRGDRIEDDRERARWAAASLRLVDRPPEEHREERQRLDEEARDWLSRWIADHPRADALSLYLEGMRRVTEASGGRFWAQKGTAYIFYAREILRDIPDARLIYPLRNPFDISASIKRRRDREPIAGCTIAWNKGLRIALRLQEEFPDRIMITRYEDLVTDPEASIRSICDFLGATFTDDLLAVPHMNPSERKYEVIPGSKGVNRSRLHYYVSVLTGAEIEAVSLLVDEALLRRYYPTLPHQDAPRRVANRTRAPILVGTSLLRYVASRFRIARRGRDPIIRRTIQRLRA